MGLLGVMEYPVGLGASLWIFEIGGALPTSLWVPKPMESSGPLGGDPHCRSGDRGRLRLRPEGKHGAGLSLASWVLDHRQHAILAEIHNMVVGRA